MMMMLSHDDGHQDAHDTRDDAHDEDNDVFDKQELIGGSGLKITNYN